MITIRVSKLEFCRNTSRYLKGDNVIITHRGEDCLDLRPIGQIMASERAFPVTSYPKVVEKEKVAEKGSVLRHACGCEREENSYLCKKHGRV